ncbi:MAG TPA: hypothetical protein VEJ88_02740 [Dissulfurispiraceae bacterium]|nr:hypothetical protein [Dissulfurispiraceae bacterium]
MTVKIMYQNDTLAEVEPSRIDELISSTKIKKILRSDGWASVATAPLRGRIQKYEGPERRGGLVSGKNPSDFATINAPSGVPDNVSILKKAGQVDIDEFHCLECGGKCEEKEILNGSNAGITLLMKCTNDACSKYFRVTCDSQGRVETALIL